MLASWFLVTIAMAVTGPFGTCDQFGLLSRLGYWALAVGVAVLFGAFAFYAAGRWWSSYAFWVRLLLASTLFTILYLPVQRMLMLSFRGPVMSLGRLALIVVALPLTVGLVKYLWLGPEVSWPRRTAPEPRLLARLAPEMRGALLHLSVNDHYVEVLTDRGKSQILLRFSDAMSELDGVEGMQVHRSHWVAREAVQGSRRQNGKLFLQLIDGSEVPVSRGFQKAVTEGGYLTASRRPASE